MFNIIMGADLVNLRRNDVGHLVGMAPLDHGVMENFGVVFPFLEPLDLRFFYP
jgi:hypothetical protein